MFQISPVRVQRCFAIIRGADSRTGRAVAAAVTASATSHISVPTLAFSVQAGIGAGLIGRKHLRGEIYRQLRGISSDRVIGLGPNKVLSVPDAVGIAIERWMQEKNGIQQELLPGAAPSGFESAPVVAGRGPVAGLGGEQMMLGGMQETLSGACPDCGSQLEFAEGCMKCHVCGFSECG